jgi:hypothetical protein
MSNQPAAQDDWGDEVQGGGNFVKFKEIGQTITGIYSGNEIDTSQYGNGKRRNFFFSLDNGVPFTVPGTADLQAKLMKVPVGYEVRMTFIGTKPAEKGKAPMKVFKVQSRPTKE